MSDNSEMFTLEMLTEMLTWNLKYSQKCSLRMLTLQKCSLGCYGDTTEMSVDIIYWSVMY